MSQQTLFPKEQHRREKAHTERVREHELGEGVKGPPEPREESDVAKHIQRQDRQEEREKKRNSDMHAKAVASANKVAILRWALNADDPDLPQEALREAQRCKARLKALARAGMTSDPSDPNFVALRDSPHAPEGWPFDDDPQEIPSSMTSQSDYEGYLAIEWVSRWRHMVPTHVIKEAKTADPSFL